ncbi:splicing factor 1 isoform X1 [Coffea eugenioides]|uniref:splicing factor 1 isoform X1 n=1 Tax=Coffea eugenioides TaxID=49369 RepID=UPI000F6110C5|nr:splicing factor 1 isoform X1 [Coffea eugenioides]
MSTKLEQSSNYSQSTATSVPASGSKISKFATKSGFLIPKNKLSGSLVPFIRGGKKGGGDAANGENNKEGQRKTKWGPDLTQDTAVRKGKALAYQTRVDQIAQQLRLGKLETEENQDLSSPFQTEEHKFSDRQLEAQELELLELERRDATGEILKLNPSYKVPADYKPVLKEAKVPIPIKENAAYNMVGLIFGPANDTQKRLEKETGAKVRVYGTRAVTGEKVEVTTPDGNETSGSYDELHVHVSADTYEKIDAAVALIELLVTPVSTFQGNPASITVTSTATSGDNVNSSAPSQGTPGTNVPAGVASGVAQPSVGSGPAPSPNHFQQYSGPWFPVGAPQTPAFPSSGFAAAPVHLSPSQFNPSSMLSIFGPRPVVTVGFTPVPQNPSLITSGPQQPQVLQRPYISHPPPLSASQPAPIQSNVTSPQLSTNQSAPTGPTQFGSSISISYQPPYAGSSKVPVNTPTSIGAGNMMSMTPATTVLQGHPSMASHPLAVSRAAPPNIFPITQQSALQSAGAAVNHPANVPYFNSSSHFQQGLSLSPLPSAAKVPGPMQSVMPRAVMPNSSPNVVPGSNPLLSPVTSSSTLLHPASGIPNSGHAGAVSFNAINPANMTAPRPQQPSSNDFTFQPHRPHNPALEVAHRPNTQPILLHPNQSAQPYQESQISPVQPGMHMLRLPPANPGFSRPNVGNQMMQPRAQTSVNFPSSPTALLGPPRHAPFPGSNAAPLLQPRNFNLDPPFVNADGIPRAGGPMQIQQNYPPSATRPPSFVAPNQHINSNISFQPAAGLSSRASGVQQVYDPFSPTSVSLNTHLSSNRAKIQKQESDPEYEDLMASVGVK